MFCEKCGKEILEEAVICPGCGCSTGKEKKKEINYDDCVKGAVGTNIIGLALIVMGTVCWLFVNMWLGAILCLVAEFIALIPNTKLQNAFKKNNLIGKTDEIKEKRKAILRDIKAKYPSYIFSFVIAVISLLLLIIFLLFI